MKKMIVLALFLFWIIPFTAQADGADSVDDLNNVSSSQDGLSIKEEEALRLSQDWTQRPIKPIQTGSGKVVFVHGATMPTIIGSPLRICDIEFESGEAINEILVGDSARWLVESGISGAGVTHIFVKPVDSGLTTSLVVTTNRRVYHMRLISRENDYTPYVGFLYQNQLEPVLRREARQKEWNTALVDGMPLDMSNLNFAYKVKGKASWKPVMVYDNGQKMYLKLPDTVRQGEVPALLVRQGNEDTLVNYRLKNNTFEVDGLFQHIVLVTGVGRKQDMVEIIKEKDIKTVHTGNSK